MSVDVKANGTTRTLVESSDTIAKATNSTCIAGNGAKVFPVMTSTQFGFNIYPETGTTFSFAGHTGTRMQVTFSNSIIGLSIYENGSWVTIKTWS